jgi:large subunit ribosomal protein L3
MNALLGRKIRMTRIFDDEGRSVPVTAIQAGPCGVVQVKTKESDGYCAVQLGFQENTKERGPGLPVAGHFRRWKSPLWKHLREVRVENPEEYTPGGTVTAEVFNPGDIVKISGVTKGKGFAGGIKRHGWSGGPKTHGSMSHRRPGSIGASAWPSRVIKGHPLPGHMGSRNCTVRNLSVVRVDPEHHVIYVRGAVPGAPGGLVLIRTTKPVEKSK